MLLHATPPTRVLLLVVALLAASAATAGDGDGDGVDDAADTCVELPNGPAPQPDADGDGIGDLCDCDFDGDGFCNVDDFGLFLTAFASGTDPDLGTDMTSDGFVNVDDFGRFLAGFLLGTPGPSGIVPDGDGDGVSPAGGDCDDADGGVHPGAAVVSGSLGGGDLARAACFERRVPNGTDPRDTDGCSANLLANAGLPQIYDPNNPTQSATPYDCSLAVFGTDDPVAPGPCDLHDACFATCGTSRAQCNAAFFANLLAVCDTLPPSQGGCVGPCRAMAAAYAAAVAVVDEDGWLNNQQRVCECACEENGPECGDGLCSVTSGESWVNCYGDCREVLPTGSVCVVDEDCAGQQCGPTGRCTLCGNGACEAGESCRATSTASCQADCGACPVGNACEVDADCEGFCDALFYCQDTLPNGSVCLKDAACTSGNCSLGFCTAQPFCGDLTCNNGETCSSCGIDCGICPFCGDFSCNNGETCATCAFDCGDCCAGNGAICAVNGDCCSDRCELFTCRACLGSGSTCNENSDCCNGSCVPQGLLQPSLCN
jgi:hypothetical protein